VSTGHGEKLTRKQEQAVAALLVYPTLEEAAEAAGISKATLWRWTQRDDFQAIYRAARRRAVSQAIGRLQQASQKAVNALEEVMADSGCPPAARVSAAKTVLEFSIRGLELEDLASRVEAIERTMKVQNGQRH